MKQTVKASIGGYAFNFDADALTKVSEYIRTLERHYLSMVGGREIMDGIEERMSELLMERCASSGVVSVADADEVIKILGHPEEIEEEDAPREKKEEADKEASHKKRLYRIMGKGAVFGGVCNGLSVYYGVDVVLFRLAFVVLAILGLPRSLGYIPGFLHISGLSFLIYAILWICIPEAKSVEEKYRARGEGVSVDDIRRGVEKTAREMKSASKRLAKSDAASEAGRVVVSVTGFIFMAIGVAGLASIMYLILGREALGIEGSWIRIRPEIYREAPYLINLVEEPFFMIMAVLAIVLPFLGILYSGVQMIFRFQPPAWKPGLLIFMLWLIVVIVLVIVILITIASAHASVGIASACTSFS